MHRRPRRWTPTAFPGGSSPATGPKSHKKAKKFKVIIGSIPSVCLFSEYTAAAINTRARLLRTHKLLILVPVFFKYDYASLLENYTRYTINITNSVPTLFSEYTSATCTCYLYQYIFFKCDGVQATDQTTGQSALTGRQSNRSPINRHKSQSWGFDPRHFHPEEGDSPYQSFFNLHRDL